MKERSLVIFNRSFWPDTEATGQFLTELSEALSNVLKVTVICGMPYYNYENDIHGINLYRREKHRNIEIIRVRHTRFWKGNLIGRLTNWTTYTILAFIVALFEVRPKAIIINTDPPFLCILGILLKTIYKVPLVFNCRDLYPDVAIELEELNEGFLSKIFDFLNIRAFNSSKKIVPLGLSMKNKILGKGVDEEKIEIIPDWADTNFLKPIKKNMNKLLKQNGLNDKFIIMYSGNIGYSQDFKSILYAIKDIKKNFILLFVGEGGAKRSLLKLCEELKLENVKFLPYQPYEKLDESLNMADLHLIPLKKGVAGSIVPSKLYGILAVGKPYLAIADSNSEPVCIAKQYNCGLWAEPGQVDSIKQKIAWALENKKEISRMGTNGRKVAVEFYDKNVVVNEWKRLLSEIGITD